MVGLLAAATRRTASRSSSTEILAVYVEAVEDREADRLRAVLQELEARDAATLWVEGHASPSRSSVLGWRGGRQCLDPSTGAVGASMSRDGHPARCVPPEWGNCD